MTHNFTTVLRRLGLSLAGITILCASAVAQVPVPHDPHAPLAYHAASFHKSTGDAKPLLSTVHYVAQADSLIPYDSSWTNYDAAEQRVVEQLLFRWNGGQWLPFDRYTYTYDANGFNNVTTYDFWNIVKGAFVPVVRYNYGHDASGNRTGLHYEVWQQTSGSFINGLLESYTLDASGLRSQVVQQNWISSDAAWRNNTLESMRYNAQGKEEYYLMQYWDPNLNSWQRKREIRTAYSSSGLVPVQREESDWNRASQQWEAKSRYLNSLSNDQIATHTTEFYDRVTATWVPASRDTRSYLANGNTAKTTLATWYGAGRVFQDAAQTIWTYTKNDQPSRVMTLVQFHGRWAVSEGAKETIYYYKTDPEELSVGGASATRIGIALAPVPANNALEVRLTGVSAGPSRLRLVDMSGRTLMDRAVDGSGTRLDLSSIAEGVYIIQIQPVDSQPISRRFSIAR